MATNTPTGMGARTVQQFNRVASNMRRFARSGFEYDAANPVDDQWRNRVNGTMTTSRVTRKMKPQTSQSSTFNPTLVSVVRASPDIGRRPPRKPSQKNQEHVPVLRIEK